ncbi:MAG: hypothetical protein ACKUBY_02130 [Candidatus Moraniibacteriota bacterium]|jgi:hypothetical protein
MQKQKKNSKRKEAIQTTRLYLVLIVVSIIVMIVSAFITHGNDTEVINISLGIVKEKITKKDDSNNIKIGADLSKVPNDKEIEKILNKVIPNVCDDCDDDPLGCLEEYKINKILIQNEGYENKLFIELLTGKHFDNTYTVVIDINTRAVISDEGSIDDDECIEVIVERAEGDEVTLTDGDDFESTTYIHRGASK